MARSKRATSRAGVRECAGFFEDRDCCFQEIDQQNDFGKDAYVDLPWIKGTEGHCVALQIKSGTSYRRPDGTYFVPIGHHANSWRESTVPVFGIVFDPDLAQLRWVDLTGYLRENPEASSGKIAIPPGNVLIHDSFSRFCDAVSVYRRAPPESLFLNLLSESPEKQGEALNDAWALSRHDARYLLLCRRLLLELPRSATRWLIWRLSHLAGNPDIFFTADTWLPQHVQNRVRASFQWSVQELVQLFLAVGDEEWGRGTLGQCLDALLAADPDLIRRVPAVTESLLVQQDVESATRVTVVALGHTPDPLTLLESHLKRYPELSVSPWLQELASALREDNQFSLYR